MRTVGLLLALATLFNVSFGSEISPNSEKRSDNLEKDARTGRPRRRNSPVVRYHLRMATEADKDAPRKNLLRIDSLGAHEQRMLGLRAILNRARAEKEEKMKSEKEKESDELSDKLEGLGLN